MSNQAQITSLTEYAKRAYLEYAMSVVKGRAIPDVEDGMKPVHRRILFAMHRLKLAPPAKYMKSARVVGDVIGQLHPHGDGAVYEAMVRMAQPFTLRYPLVEGEGNFGSRDGDTAAAMRYTEARLAPIAAAVLDELKWDTVDYKPNFDGTQEEPDTLPARLPFLLLNGASGIGVGLATELPPHNLGETIAAAKMLLLKPKSTIDDVLTVLPGPDFATGANLISTPQEIRKIYTEGRGSFRLRAKWEIEGEGTKRWKLVFRELPQTTSTQKIMLEVDELMDPKPKEKNGKKLPLKPEQLRLKKLFGDLIDTITDASDLDAPVCIVIEPKDRKMDPQALALTLCAHTTLEDTVPTNLVAVDNKGTPRQSTLIDWLGQWCEYRITTVTRRLRDEKNRVDRRLHLLEGRLKVLDHLRDVIDVLEKSDQPKQDLMDKFGLDEIQAEDVLDMRLRQVARLEKNNIIEEIGKLKPEQKRLGDLLADEKSIRKLIIKELDADEKAFGDARRTMLAPAESSAASRSKSNSSADIMVERLPPEPIAVVLTERGWLGWRPAKSWEDALASDFKIKTGDSIKRMFFGDRNADFMLLMDENGRAYSLRLMDLPSKMDMLPLTTWFDLQGKIAEGALGNGEQKWIVAGSGGCGFVVKANDWINRMKAGKAFLTLAADEKPLPPVPLPADVDGKSPVLALATDGRAVAFTLDDVKVLPKGKGVSLMGFAKDHHLSDIALAVDGLQLQTAKGSVAKLNVDVGAFMGPRSAGKKGKALHKQSEGAVFVRPGREVLKV